MKVDVRTRRRPSRGQNSYRWDEIGGYLVSTIRLSDAVAAVTGQRFETLVYSIAAGEWDVDDSGVQSPSESAADAAHAAACARITDRMQ
jgi:hypothetical protein